MGAALGSGRPTRHMRLMCCQQPSEFHGWSAGAGAGQAGRLVGRRVHRSGKRGQAGVSRRVRAWPAPNRCLHPQPARGTHHAEGK